MYFCINTEYGGSNGLRAAGAGRVVLEGLVSRLEPAGHAVVRNQWDSYDGVDVTIFMARDSQVREAKQKNKKMLCGIFDPKPVYDWQRAEVRAADFLIVSSIEQRDFFLRYNKNVFIYYMFPDVPEIPKQHDKKEKIIIGYHGNKQHLDGMPMVSRALDVLAQKYPIELWAIYNVGELGVWSRNRPKKCPVRHIQWSPDVYATELTHCDIGIMPSTVPVHQFWARPLRSLIRFLNYEGYNRNDYIQRYKMSNNPGRLYPFVQLGIPVVTDFTPSSCQFIEQGVSGFLAGSVAGWECAIEQLIQDVDLRTTMSYSLKQTLDNHYSIQCTFDRFISFVHSISNTYE